MAAVAVWTDDLIEGKLPFVCSKTDARADTYVQVRFVTTPGWTWILLLFGILPFLIARYFSLRRLRGMLPMSARALRRGKLYDMWVWILLIGGLFLIGLAFAFAGLGWGPAAGWTGLISMLAAVVLLAFGWTVWPSAEIDERWVWLRHVHPKFAEAVIHAYGPRAPVA